MTVRPTGLHMAPAERLAALAQLGGQGVTRRELCSAVTREVCSAYSGEIDQLFRSQLITHTGVFDHQRGLGPER